MMQFRSSTFVAFFVSKLAFALACLGSSNPDFVSRLPGFNQPLPSPWYSGFVEYELEGRTVHTHYVLVEAEEDFHKNKPLIYWSNGGPGASSLFGLLTELGPLLFSDESLHTAEYEATGIPTPIYNPYAWTRLGHVLIIDQPAPVGFSYCNDDVDSHSCAGLAWTDELAAENAHLALLAFHEKFPCYGTNELYLTGESYAGIYIPTLARRILEDPENHIPLKGLAVGDGCLGTETSICGDLSNPDAIDIWNILFLAGHGQMPMATFQEVMHACRPHKHPLSPQSASSADDFSSNEENYRFLKDSDICQAALAKVDRQVGGYYGYSLYDECTYSGGLLGGALNDYPCGGDAVMQHYLSLPVVKEALHVTNATFFSVDNADGDFDYTPTEPDLSGFYRSINGKIRVLVYNGDTDPAITSFAAQNWTTHLHFTETQEWRPWTVDGCRRMGGYVTRYDGDFDFLTIRGAGHMVPTYKAAATFTFMRAWIEDKDYPAFSKDCEAPNAVNVLQDATQVQVEEHRHLR
jgi:carboxypeptidase C (cathepsin A)